MLDARTLIRPLLAAPFVVAGVNALRAGGRQPPAAKPAGGGIDPATLAKINGGVQVGAGALLAFGIVPRVASLVLSASAVSSMATDQRFWQEGEQSKREGQMVQFARSAGLLGGLLAATLDTGGRPSVFWSGRRAAERAARSVAETAGGVYHSLPLAS
jgi:uncharacterized membrane protein YphA (DoxX/SURF4 family)